jgi:hypothetical protein
MNWSGILQSRLDVNIAVWDLTEQYGSWESGLVGNIASW